MTLLHSYLFFFFRRLPELKNPHGIAWVFCTYVCNLQVEWTWSPLCLKNGFYRALVTSISHSFFLIEDTGISQAEGWCPGRGKIKAFGGTYHCLPRRSNKSQQDICGLHPASAGGGGEILCIYIYFVHFLFFRTQYLSLYLDLFVFVFVVFSIQI